MKTCRKCHVSLNTSRTTCPLCHTYLDDNGVKDFYQEYPPYKKILNKNILTIKILLFITIIAVVASVLINVLTVNKEHASYWSVIVIGGIIFLWVLIGVTIISKRNAVFKIILQSLTVALLFYTIEINSSLESGWSLKYIMPFIISGVIMTSGVLCLAIPKKAASYSIYILVLSIIGIVIFVVNLLKEFEPLWPSITCLAVSGVTILGLFFFGGKPLLEEIKKKMYF